MRYCLVISVLLVGLFLPLCSAKAQNVDSLMQELPKQKEDTIKLWLLDEIIILNSYNDEPRQTLFINAMLELAKKLQHPKGEGNAYRHFAIYYSSKNDWKMALNYIDKADSLYTRHKDQAGLAFISIFLGAYYTSQGKYEDALLKYQAAFSYCEKLGSVAGQSIVLGSLGLLFEKMERYEEAETYFLRSLEIRQKQGDKRGMAVVLNNLGCMQMGIRNYDKALEYLNACLQLEKELNDLQVITNCRLNIANIYIEKGRLTEATGILKECYQNYAILGDTVQAGYTRMYEARVWRKSGNPQKALVLLDKAIQMVLPFEPDQIMLGDFYDEYCEIYKAMGAYKEAFEYYEKMVEARSDIFSAQTAEKISDLKEKYETKKKEQENIALKNTREIQDLKFQRQWYFIYGLAGIFLLLFIVFVLWIRSRKIISEQKTMRLEQKMLRSQMNPHFIFNALIAIQSFMFKNEPATAGKFLSSFARLMRGILENSREEFITLAKELNWMENYMDLQKLRFDNKFNYQIEMDKNIDPENTLIPPMLTQPFIENALEHGFNNLEIPGQLMVVFKKNKGLLMVDIIDNGMGIDLKTEKEKDQGHISLATRITKERLLLLNKRKTKKIHFYIYSSPGNGTRVSFSIPFRTKI